VLPEDDGTTVRGVGVAGEVDRAVGVDVDVL
jgi:hypothetical protein